MVFDLNREDKCVCVCREREREREKVKQGNNINFYHTR